MLFSLSNFSMKYIRQYFGPSKYCAMCYVVWWFLAKIKMEHSDLSHSHSVLFTRN